jgi:hypothetical protein
MSKITVLASRVLKAGLVLAALSCLLPEGLARGQTRPVGKPASAQATRPTAKPAPRPAPGPPAPAPTPPPATTILDGSSVWRALHSWNAPLAKTAEGYTEVRGKDPFNFMTVYPPPDWTEVGFDDSCWSRRHFFVKYSNGEIDQRAGGGGATPNLRQLSLRGKFTVTDPAKVKTLWLTLGYRGGVIVYLNGKEVARQFLPEGKVEPGAPAELYPRQVYLREDGKPQAWWPPNKEAEEAYKLRPRRLEKLPLPLERLRKGVNVLAVEIHAAAYVEEYIKAGIPWGACGLIELRLQTDEASGIVANVVRPKGVQIWNTNLVETITDANWADPHEPLQPIRLYGARNGAYSGRVMVSSDQDIKALKAQISEMVGPGGRKLPASAMKVRYGALWSVAGSEARDDALLDAPPPESPVRAKPSGTDHWSVAARKAREADGLPPRPVDGAFQSVLVTACVPRDAAPGDYRGTLTITVQDADKPFQAPVELKVSDWALPDPKDFAYWYGLVQSPEGVSCAYEVPLWSPRHWELIGKSFDLIAQTGGRVLFIPLTAETEYGNEQSMALWVKSDRGVPTAPASQPGPRLTCDLGHVQKYVEVALAHMGRPTYVVVGVWQWSEQGRCPRISVLDPASGKIENTDGPLHGTPESLAFWAPVLTMVRDILAGHGLAETMLLGWGSDAYPNKPTVGVFHQILPDVGWEAHRHWPNGGEYCPYEGGQVPVVYQSGVWGQWDNKDPDVARPYGWKFPYPIKGGRRTWLDRGTYDNYAFIRFRGVPEQILLANRPGIGQVGADFWPPKAEKGKTQFSTLYSRFPRTANVGAGNKGCTTSQLFYPGPEGSVPSVRFELTRENIQECEARILLEKLIPDRPARSTAPAVGPLGEQLARQCQAVLDERARWHRLNHSMGAPEMEVAWPYSGWEIRSGRLFQACAEAAGHLASSRPTARLSP